MKGTRTRLVAFAVLAIAAAACKKKPADNPTDPVVKTAEGSAAAPADPAKPVEAGKPIVEAARQAGGFTTFLKAVDAAGLAEHLNGPGPFTIFAPTDDAFAKLAPKDLDALLADKARLTDVLQYHVVAQTLSSKDLGVTKTAKSVQGTELAIDTASGVKVAGATVVKPDVIASNGVIHGIDTVLLPPAK